MWVPVIAVCIWSLGELVVPVDSSHFMGGIIHWRPVNPAAFDGRVRNHKSQLCTCQLYAPPPPVGDKRGIVGDLTISLINIASPGAS